MSYIVCLNQSALNAARVAQERFVEIAFGTNLVPAVLTGKPAQLPYDGCCKKEVKNDPGNHF